MPLALLQVDYAIAADLNRIAWAQIIMAVMLVLITLAVLALMVATYILVRRLTRTIERTMERLTPQAQQIMTRASGIADDAGLIARSARKEAESMLATVQRLNGQLREFADAAETRVRELGAVLDVVQEEAEELLLDATATARGVQAGARALRRPRHGRHRPPRGE